MGRLFRYGGCYDIAGRQLGRTIRWDSTICRCYVICTVDTKEPLYQEFSCDDEHQPWCSFVGRENLTRRISEITSVWNKDIEKMRQLLVWRDVVFMRPKFKQSQNGLMAYQCFWDWDTKGVSLPQELEDPQLLEDLVQGKRCREFTIDQWVETYEKREEYPIWPEEYLDHPGMDVELFKKLFGREPTQEIVDSIRGYEKEILIERILSGSGSS